MQGSYLPEGLGPAPVEPMVLPKAQVFNRFIAKFLDFLIAGGAMEIASPIGWMSGLTYILIADGFSRGRSLGKLLIGLQIVIPQTHEAPGFKESIIRNLPFGLAILFWLIPLVGWSIGLLILGVEVLLVLGNERGLRLGDEMASTQVLDDGILDERH